MVALITNNGNQWCSGFLIGPDTLVTAGHCVHPGGAGSTWYPPAAFRVYPAYNPASANPTPFGSCGVTRHHGARRVDHQSPTTSTTTAP